MPRRILTYFMFLLAILSAPCALADDSYLEVDDNGNTRTVGGPGESSSSRGSSSAPNFNSGGGMYRCEVDDKGRTRTIRPAGASAWKGGSSATKRTATTLASKNKRIATTLASNNKRIATKTTAKGAARQASTSSTGSSGSKGWQTVSVDDSGRITRH